MYMACTCVTVPRVLCLVEDHSRLFLWQNTLVGVQGILRWEAPVVSYNAGDVSVPLWNPQLWVSSGQPYTDSVGSHCLPRCPHRWTFLQRKREVFIDINIFRKSALIKNVDVSELLSVPQSCLTLCDPTDSKPWKLCTITLKKYFKSLAF